MSLHKWEPTDSQGHNMQCTECGLEISTEALQAECNSEPPYSEADYEDAKQKGLDLDNWNHYVLYYGLGLDPDEESLYL